MADVRPFHGLRYNLDKAGDLSSLITPPYDVINSAQQEAYHQRNPYNIIRLEFGKELPDDDDQTNKYTRAAQTLNDWIQQDILIRDDTPAFYLTEHRFPEPDGYRSYWGLVAAVRLEEFETGQIRPTEIIMHAPAADRFNLLKSCRVNLSPIMGMVRWGEGSLKSLFPDIDRESPSLTATDDFGVIFNLWIVVNEEAVQRVSDFFAERAIYIADGHHRYTTALAYRNEQLTADSPENNAAASNFLMMTIISTGDTGLTLLPMHRMVRNIKSKRMASLKDQLSDYFQIQALPPSSSDFSQNRKGWKASLDDAGKKGPAFGLYGLADDNYLLLTPHNISALRAMLPEGKPKAWRDIDVSLLHGVIIQRILGIDTPEKEQERLEYTSDETEVLRKVESGAAQLGFFLNPVPVSSVLKVADADVRMPPKSTYFYPKTAAGLVMNPLF